MFMLVFYLVLSLGVSFLCSLLESVLLSVPMSHVSLMAERGEPAGRKLMNMKSSLDRPLAAILSLNTIAHTVGAAGVGAEAATLFGEAWVGAVSAILTLLILLLSEVVPKSFGAAHCRGLAPLAARLIGWMIVGLYPLVVVCEKLSRWLATDATHPAVSRDELRVLAMIGHTAGQLDHDEAKMIANVIALRQTKVHDVMTPRTVVSALPADRLVREVFADDEPPRFSRMPVIGDSLDEVLGLVHRYDLVSAIQRGDTGTPVRDLMRPAKAIPGVADLVAALRQFTASKQNMFIVVDEYGGTAGVVTLEDVLESLIGHEIVDETDTAVDMRTLAALRQKRAEK